MQLQIHLNPYYVEKQEISMESGIDYGFRVYFGLSLEDHEIAPYEED